MILKGLFAATFVTALVTGQCGSSDGFGLSVSPRQDGWVEITEPTEESRHFTDSGAVTLKGKSFISEKHKRCCPYDAGVFVTWQNTTTGHSGTAESSMEVGLIFANHAWSAYVPLACGENMIALRAMDPAGIVGTDSITVIRKRSPSCP